MDQTTNGNVTQREKCSKTPSPPKSLLGSVRFSGITSSGSPTSEDVTRPATGTSGGLFQKKRFPSSQTLQTAAFMPHTRFHHTGHKSAPSSVYKRRDGDANEDKDDDETDSTDQQQVSNQRNPPAATPECDRVLRRLERSGLLSKIRSGYAASGTRKSGSQLLNKTILLPAHRENDGENDADEEEDEDPEEAEWRRKQIEMIKSDDEADEVSAADEGGDNSESSSTKEQSTLNRDRDHGSECSTPSEPKRTCNQQPPPGPCPGPALGPGPSITTNPAPVSQLPANHIVPDPLKKSPIRTVRKPPEQPVRPPPQTQPVPQSSHSTVSHQPAQSASTSATTSTTTSSKLRLESISVNGKVYHVLRQLGKGGTATVQEVYDPIHQRLYAMKLVDLSQADDSARRAFKNEINLLRKLQDCERVVKIHDFEYKREQDQLLLVMEKGDADLANVLKSFIETDNNQLDADAVKFYWKEMLKAVREIHTHGIVHADLKPVNFITVAGKLKLIDFGIANALVDDATSVIKDHQVGTINYMSPEALTNRSAASDQTLVKYNQKSDIWSLGCILYNLIYGYPPFGHYKDLLGKFKAITNPNHRIKFHDKAHPLVVDCMKQCLQYDPTKRPTADQLLRHPYLSNATDSTTRRTTSDDQTTAASSGPGPQESHMSSLLLSQINGFTPNRMRQLSKVVEQLAKSKK